LPKKSVSTIDKKEEGETKKQVIKKPKKSISNKTPPIETKKEEKKAKKKSTVEKISEQKKEIVLPKKIEEPKEHREIRSDINKILKDKSLSPHIIDNIIARIIENKKLKTKLKDIISKTLTE